ncbi:hypothetical protein EB796_010934 [Bugula neritina]|uniref:Sushi domain-containing protein n=1 Tax=Bugula neritina TaxID=10212 RepID=A0A7J7JXS9_BUGNE|nr:hypothetical protein EB796_010934 [Bugula neritina]
MGPDKRSCLSLGHWSGIETYCQDVTCPALSFTLNGYVDPPICTQTTQEYGVICRLRCYQGYTLDGPSFRQCSNTGTWTSASYSWRCLDNSVMQLIGRPTNHTGLTITASHSFRHSWRYGTTPVTVTAADKANNIASCTFNVTVLQSTEYCEREARLEASQLSCNQYNSTYASCNLQCKVGAQLMYPSATQPIICSEGKLNTEFIPDCSAPSLPVHTLFMRSEVRLSEACGDKSSINASLAAIHDQVAMHLAMLCGDTLKCVASLTNFECIPSATYSVVTLEYSLELFSPGQSKNIIQDKDLLMEMEVFLRAFYSGGLFIGYSLPVGFLHDVSFTFNESSVDCVGGLILQADLCCRFISIIIIASSLYDVIYVEPIYTT